MSENTDSLGNPGSAGQAPTTAQKSKKLLLAISLISVAAVLLAGGVAAWFLLGSKGGSGGLPTKAADYSNGAIPDWRADLESISGGDGQAVLSADPVFLPGSVVLALGGNNNQVVSLDKGSGKVRDRVDLGSSGNNASCSPTDDPTTAICVISTADSSEIFSVTNSKIKSLFSAPGAWLDLAAHGDRVYAIGQSSLASFNPSTNDAWQIPLDEKISSASPVFELRASDNLVHLLAVYEDGGGTISEYNLVATQAGDTVYSETQTVDAANRCDVAFSDTKVFGFGASCDPDDFKLMDAETFESALLDWTRVRGSSGDLIIIATGESLIGLDAKTSRVLWESPASAGDSAMFLAGHLPGDDHIAVVYGREAQIIDTKSGSRVEEAVGSVHNPYFSWFTPKQVVLSSIDTSVSSADSSGSSNPPLSGFSVISAQNGSNQGHQEIEPASVLYPDYSGFLAVNIDSTLTYYKPAPEKGPNLLDSAYSPESGILPVSIPSCEAMNVTAKEESDLAIKLFNLTMPQGSHSLSDIRDFSNYSPAIQGALDASSSYGACMYPVGYHSVVMQTVAELDEASMEQLVLDLTGDGYQQSDASGATLLSKREAASEGDMLGIELNYFHIIAGNAWAMVIENGMNDYVPAALNGLMEKNPELVPGFKQMPLPAIIEPQAFTGVLMPSCEALAVGDMVPAGSASQQQFNDSGPGPVARDAYSNAVSVNGCAFTGNGSKKTLIYVADLPGSTRDNFIGELRASDYIESMTGGALEFRYTVKRTDGNYFVTFFFVDNLWVTMIDATYVNEFPVLNRILDYNPHL